MFLGELADRYGRVARGLRVSLTDRCNLRCSYCMPAEGLQWLPTEETLTDDEVNASRIPAGLAADATCIRSTDKGVAPGSSSVSAASAALTGAAGGAAADGGPAVLPCGLDTGCETLPIIPSITMAARANPTMAPCIIFTM